jgi:hypothetical protein
MAARKCCAKFSTAISFFKIPWKCRSYPAAKTNAHAIEAAHATSLSNALTENLDEEDWNEWQLITKAPPQPEPTLWDVFVGEWDGNNPDYDRSDPGYLRYGFGAKDSA